MKASLVSFVLLWPTCISGNHWPRPNTELGRLTGKWETTKNDEAFFQHFSYTVYLTNKFSISSSRGLRWSQACFPWKPRQNLAFLITPLFSNLAGLRAGLSITASAKCPLLQSPALYIPPLKFLLLNVYRDLEVTRSPCSVSLDLAREQINKQENQRPLAYCFPNLNYPEKHDYTFISVPN